MPKRYFENPFSDLAPGQEVEIKRELWETRIRELVESIKRSDGSPDTPDKYDGGLYVGRAGIAYMLWYVASKQTDLSSNLANARELGLAHYRFCTQQDQNDQGSRLGFLLGNTGVYAVNTVIAHSVGDPQADTFLQLFRNASEDFLTPDPLGVGSDEMLVGRAGYLSGCLWLQARLGCQVLPEAMLHKLCDLVVECGRRFSRRTSSKSPLMYQYYETQYLGAAHGLTGILQTLLSVPGYFQHNPEAEKEVRGSVDWLVTLQTYEGNFPCAMGDLKDPRHYSDELVHWCHGAPGTVYLLARAHLTWGGKETAYMPALEKAANITWRRGLLKKGPGLCHGVAGSGYVFLLMYRLTRNKMYLHRAAKFAEFLFSETFRGARTPDSPLSLYEGWAGTACFLVDLLNPDQASFPFSEVFL